MDTKPNTMTDRGATTKARFQRAERRQIEWKPAVTPQLYRHWLDKHDRKLMQKQYKFLPAQIDAQSSWF